MRFPSNVSILTIFIHTTVLVSLFILIYTLQYTREYRVRKLNAQERGVSEIRRVFTPPQFENNTYVLETGRYILEFKQDPSLQTGECFHFTGSSDDLLRVFTTHHFRMRIQSFYKTNCSSSLIKIRFFSILRAFQAKKHEIVRKILILFSQAHGNLLLGIVMGNEIERDTQLYRILQKTGMLHVAVASGSNIAIIASFSSALIRSFFRGKSKIIATFIFVFSYCFFTNFDPSILRAFGMFSTVLAGRFFGRHIEGKRAFLYVCGLLLCFDPFLLYSASFQLSACATAGLLWINPCITPPFPLRGDTVFIYLGSELYSLFFTSLSVLIFTIPVQLSLFGSISIVSLLSNVLLGYLVTPILFLGIIFTLALEFSLVPIWILCTYPLWVLLEVFVRMINLIVSMPLLGIPIIHTHPLYAWGALIGFVFAIEFTSGSWLARVIKNKG